MRERPAALLSRHALALAATAAAVLLRWLLDPWLGEALPLVTLYGAVAFAVWRGGYGPAITSTIAGYAACNLLFIAPRGVLGVGSAGQLLGAALYVVTCAIIVGFGAATQAARRHAVDGQEALRASERRLAVELAAVRRMQQVSARLVQASGLPELLREILEAAIEITGADMGNIQLVQDGRLKIACQRGFEPAFLEHFDGVGEGRAACGTAMFSGRRVVVEDVAKSSLFAGTRDGGVLTAAGVRAVQSTPLIGPTGRLLGMFSTHYRAPHRPTETELQHVDVLARLAGDLLDREQAQVALRESEERFRSMADAAPVMIWLSGTDGLCTWLNQRWLEFVGRTMEQEIGDGWTENIHPADLERCITNYTTAFEARRPFVMEYRLRRHDGEHRWVLDNGIPRNGPDARFAGYIGICMDITERKAAQAELEAKDEELRRVTSITPLVLTRCGRDLRYRFVNRAAAALFGLAPEDMVGRPIPEIMGEEAFAVIRPQVERVLRGEPVEYEAEIRYAEAGLRWVRVNYQPELDRRGEVSGWIGTITDISERKEFERGLQEADRRKDEFLSMLAHELRNPLAPIRSGVQVLLSRELADPELRRCTQVIERQVAHMARLLEDLLDVTRITHRRLELRRERVDLATVIAAAVETSRPAIDEGGHELVVSLPDEPVLLDADPVRLAQVLSNLLNNAAHHTEAGGHLRVSAEREGAEALVTVSDDGIGIAPERLPRLFDMFSPAGPAAAHAPDGLGIGLALARLLVELHGGRIAARSEGPGRGSAFTVRLPVASDAPAGGAAPPSRPARAGRGAAVARRVLVADDLQDSADMLALLLRSMGHEVRAVYDGEQAVAAAAEFEPDVVLLDIGMPKLDGYDACRQIRARANGRRPLLVALTGWDQEQHRRRGEEAGFDRHLIKPVDPALLAELLGSLEEATAPRATRSRS